MNAALISEPGPVDSTTETRRLDLWREDASGGQWGDQAIEAGGYGLTARYLSDDGYGCGELAFYPVLWDDGSYGVDESWTWGRAITEDGLTRPDDSADIEYDYGSTLAYDSLEAAQSEAERLGRIDWSFAIYLRRPATA